LGKSIVGSGLASGTSYVGGVAIEGEDWIGVLGETVVKADVLIACRGEEMLIG
jgi:hypothetical protein